MSIYPENNNVCFRLKVKTTINATNCNTDRLPIKIMLFSCYSQDKNYNLKQQQTQNITNRNKNNPFLQHNEREERKYEHLCIKLINPISKCNTFAIIKIKKK